MLSRSVILRRSGSNKSRIDTLCTYTDDFEGPLISGCGVILESDGKEYYLGNLDTINGDQDRVNSEGLYYAESYIHILTHGFVCDQGTVCQH